MKKTAWRMSVQMHIEDAFRCDRLYTQTNVQIMDERDGGSGLTTRREFLKESTAYGVLAVTSARSALALKELKRPRFPDSDPRWSRTWDAALTVLSGNIRKVPHSDGEVLVEGSVYPGVWQECAPLEGLVYGSLGR